jgi:hypothetical protein
MAGRGGARKITSIEANASKARLHAQLRKVALLLQTGRRREAERLLKKIAEDDELWLWAILAGLETEE